MSNEAKQLLVKMAREYDVSKRNSFDSFFYMDFQKRVLFELEDEGCIVIKNDVVGSIQLTEFGYQEANR